MDFGVNLPIMEHPKKVYFFTHYSSMNGANQSLFSLIKYLKDKVEIKKVFVPTSKSKNGGLPMELEKIGIPVELVNLRPFLYFSGLKSFLALPLKFILNIPSWIKIYNQLKNENVDWIYSNSSVENTGIVIAKLLGAKHVWHVREFGYRDYKYMYLGGDFIKRKMLGLSDKVIAISESIFKYIDLPKRTSLIRNGIFYRNELSSLNGKENLPSIVNLGMVGIIGVAKNQKRAVKLLKNIVDDISKRKVHLDFYGGTSGEAYLNELKKEISNNDLNEFVTFHGFVDDKNEIYGNIDILLMCSPNEAFGRVTIEAMAYGIPVIGYDSAGTAELIENGRNGFLYDDREIDLEESVKALLSNEELYDILSKGARNSAQLYSVERYGASIFKLINENGHDK